VSEFTAEPHPDDPRTLTVAGELDLASVELFLSQARAALDGSVLTLDCAGLTFIDSTGLGALVRLREEARGRGSDVVLTRVPSQVSRILDLTGLSQIFPSDSG
jgi:anti-sigma B factor antagonist